MARINDQDFVDYNIVGAGTSITGDFATTGNVRIDGTFEGKISTNGKLIVGRAAKINGGISCQNADIEGCVTANIEVAEHLSLKSTAKVIGDVCVDKISIEPGAVFVGHCKMAEDKQTTLDMQ